MQVQRVTFHLPAEREELAEPHAGQRPPAEVHDPAGAARERARWQRAARDDRAQRDHVALAAGADREPLDRGQRERESDDHRGAGAFPALDPDRALERLDTTPHDVHAHTPPREIRDDRRGREPGLEHETEELVVGERLGVRAAAFGADPRRDAGAAHACAVVVDA
jgi:hypothetical protein